MSSSTSKHSPKIFTKSSTDFTNPIGFLGIGPREMRQNPLILEKYLTRLIQFST